MKTLDRVVHRGPLKVHSRLGWKLSGASVEAHSKSGIAQVPIHSNVSLVTSIYVEIIASLRYFILWYSCNFRLPTLLAF